MPAPSWLGASATVQQRRVAIVDALAAADSELSTQEVVNRVRVPYATAYADLRKLAGCDLLPYGLTGRVNLPGRPVVWIPWSYTRPATSWTVTDETRALYEATVAFAELGVPMAQPPAT